MLGGIKVAGADGACRLADALSLALFRGLELSISLVMCPTGRIAPWVRRFSATAEPYALAPASVEEEHKVGRMIGALARGFHRA